MSGSTLGFAVGSGRKDPFSPPVKSFSSERVLDEDRELTDRGHM